MFHKIDLKFDQLDLSRLKGKSIQRYGGITKYNVYDIKDYDYFYSLHKGRIKFGIMPFQAYYAEIEGEKHLWPHIDPASTCKLNYYVETADCTTSFWKEKEELDFTKLAEQVNYRPELEVSGFNDLSKLEEIGSFKANTGEAFLIRVDILHSVTPPKGVRKMISYIWDNVTIEEVLESITIP